MGVLQARTKCGGGRGWLNLPDSLSGAYTFIRFSPNLGDAAKIMNERPQVGWFRARREAFEFGGAAHRRATSECHGTDL